MGTRATIARLVVSILLAMLTTFLLAVAASALSARTARHTLFEHQLAVPDDSGRWAPSLAVCDRVSIGYVRRIWQVQRDFTVPLSAAMTAMMGSSTRHGLEMPPSWGALSAGTNDLSRVPGFGVECAAGWPFLAFWCSVDLVSPARVATSGVRGGFELPGGGSWVLAVRAVPLRPIWTGLVLNTLFYSVCWLVVVWAVGSLRRVRRLTSGKCVACGYDLRGIKGGCPECGRRISSARSRTGAATS